MWYLLALHSQVEARLHEELSGVLGGGAPTPENIARLTYAGRIVNEPIRRIYRRIEYACGELRKSYRQ